MQTYICPFVTRDIIFFAALYFFVTEPWPCTMDTTSLEISSNVLNCKNFEKIKFFEKVKIRHQNLLFWSRNKESIHVVRKNFNQYFAKPASYLLPGTFVSVQAVSGSIRCWRRRPLEIHVEIWSPCVWCNCKSKLVTYSTLKGVLKKNCLSVF